MRKLELAVIFFALAGAVVFAPGMTIFLVGDRIKSDSHCEATAYEADQPNRTIAASPEQGDAAGGKPKGGDGLVYRPRLAVRQVCSAPPGGALDKTLAVIVAAVAAAIAAMGYVLSAVTAREERPTKRGRLIAVFPDDGSAVIRVVNIGESYVRLLGIGWTAGRRDAHWRCLKTVSRLVPKGDSNAIEFPFFASVVDDGASFSVLLRYEDAYRRPWHAWRVFRMTPSGRVAVEEDGERQGSRYWWRQHLAFLWSLKSRPFFTGRGPPFRLQTWTIFRDSGPISRLIRRRDP